MRSKTFWALAVLNVALASVLVWRMTGEPSAQAQINRPSDYLMIPARAVGASGGIVYVLDSAKQQLSATYYDENTKSIEVMPPIDLSRIFQAGAGVGGAKPPLRRP